MIMKKLRQIRENQKKNGKKGFSMIELIIVIAIMAILIALIGTQLIPYMEKSRQSKDLTTLDTCLLNFQAALAEAEIKAPAGSTWNGIQGLTSDGTYPKLGSAYTTLAGEAYDTDGELNSVFKSDKSGTANVIFGVESDGTCYVKKGELYVSSRFSGVTNTP